MYNLKTEIKYWQLQDAKARLSELVRFAVQEAPQGISVRGNQEVVVISKQEYEKLIPRQESFAKFMGKSPLVGSGINLEREQSIVEREIDL